ncbi:redoxin domain-containing protein [Mucilaginibacter mali]|uniref:Redoxin domain-containing protein n=1 Tax=Mucilaginibacter mali TaxID=2740462 RepID=A0A7D4UP38_9SPHI|nr:redoxin domain-containing protein [Mucilaginibacter mali]QKJ32601.1 redoxin domain-containing protein [Mucilaginibacter mali]
MKNTLSIVFSFCVAVAFGQGRSNPAVDSLKNEADPAKLKMKLAALGNSNNENDLATVVQYYASTNQSPKGDSVIYAAAAKFPHGRYALLVAMNNFSHESDPVKQEALFAELQKTFPDKTESMEFNQAHNTMAVTFAEAKNTVKALYHLQQVKGRSNAMAIATAFLAYDPAAAEKLVKPELDRLKPTLTETAPAQGNGRGGNNNKAMYYSYEILYSKILAKQGNNAEALKYAKDAYDYFPKTTINDATKSYAYLLAVNGQYQEALPLLTQIASEGRSNAELTVQLKTAYEKVNPGKDGSAYLASVKNDLLAKVSADLGKKMTNDQSPDFRVTDVNGKKVSLADYKGKTIVLDFWATWCGPCKASFPAMQLAVNQYRNDPNVKFLFIHTWERSTTPLADAKAYIAANNYTFPLYMDVKDAKSKINPAVTAFKVPGIPSKFIIDGNGKIRFHLTGFTSGQDEANAAELAAMIEMARKGS